MGDDSSIDLRRILLKVMLWSLGVGAVLGAVSMLLASYETVWQIVGTCFATAFAALLMFACTVVMDRQNGHAAGLTGMIAVLVEYFLTLALIWELLDSLGLQRWNDELTITMVLSAPVVVVLMVLLSVRGYSLTRVAGNAGVLLAGVQLLLLWIAIWNRAVGLSRWDDELYATAAFFALFAAIVVAALIGEGTGDRRWWRWIGFGGAVAGFLVSMVGVWTDARGGETLLAALIALAAYPAFANLLMLCPLQASQRWLRLVTLVAAAVAALCVVLAVYLQRGQVFDMIARTGGAAAIIGGCGTLALLVLARLNRRFQIRPDLVSVNKITIICPVCKKKQTLPLGEAWCGTCGLEFHIRALEPRCPTCGYVLLMLQAERCPECGTPTHAHPSPPDPVIAAATQS